MRSKAFNVTRLWFYFSPFLLVFNYASALPQYQRFLRQEYGFKAPCASCHSQGGGSSLSVYGKAFERSGKSKIAIKNIASTIPKGDTFDFGTKLKARANPNDPSSTPTLPGDWAGKSDIPTAELRDFTPSEIDVFTLLEGELKPAQIEKLKIKDSFQEEDKYPTFYFGEVGGKKKFVVQYIRISGLNKTLGLVVSTKGDVVSLAFVGAQKSEIPKELKEKVLGLKLIAIEKLVGQFNNDNKHIVQGVLRGLEIINLVFAK